MFSNNVLLPEDPLGPLGLESKLRLPGAREGRGVPVVLRTRSRGAGGAAISAQREEISFKFQFISDIRMLKSETI